MDSTAWKETPTRPLPGVDKALANVMRSQWNDAIVEHVEGALRFRARCFLRRAVHHPRYMRDLVRGLLAFETEPPTYNRGLVALVFLAAREHHHSPRLPEFVTGFLNTLSLGENVDALREWLHNDPETILRVNHDV